MDELQKLKAEVYDLLVVLEEVQRQLQAKNQQIRDVSQQIEEAKKVSKEIETVE